MYHGHKSTFIIMTYMLFILGFLLLIKGADYLVDGSSSIAKRFGVSNLVIGLTIVSFGTSAPELLVNIVASVRGAGDVGMGNVIGSNIANILLILGVSALIFPLHIKKSTTWKEIPLNLLAGAVLFVLANDVLIDRTSDSLLSRSDGIILMLFFIIFIYYTYNLAKTEKNGSDGYHKYHLPKAFILTLAGIVALGFGGQWVVDGAILIAERLQLSEALVGLTVVAVGTSLPELVTSAMAAYKKNADIAVGNVVGSNIFNIFWVMGLSATIRPVSFLSAINVDLMVFMIATILLFVFSMIGKNGSLGKKEGFIFVFLYVGYLFFLVLRG